MVERYLAVNRAYPAMQTTLRQAHRTLEESLGFIPTQALELLNLDYRVKSINF